MAPEPPSEITPTLTGVPVAWSGVPSAADDAGALLELGGLVLVLELELQAARARAATATAAMTRTLSRGLRYRRRAFSTIYLPCWPLLVRNVRSRWIGRWTCCPRLRKRIL
jgi:hypothetical protein